MNILYVNSLEANNKELARQLASANVLIAEQNKLGKERQEWALHTSEVIRGLNQQLSAALAACKQKDAALQNCEGMLDELRDYPITHDAIIEALAVQPDDSALKSWIGEPVAYIDDHHNLRMGKVRITGPLYKPKELK